MHPQVLLPEGHLPPAVGEGAAQDAAVAVTSSGAHWSWARASTGGGCSSTPLAAGLQGVRRAWAEVRLIKRQSCVCVCVCVCVCAKQ